MNNVYLSVIVMVLLSSLLASVLSFAYSKLSIKQNERVNEIRELLPGANCGACGCANCEEFAKKLVEKKITVDKCRITARNKEAVAKINKLLNG